MRGRMIAVFVVLLLLVAAWGYFAISRGRAVAQARIEGQSVARELSLGLVRVLAIAIAPELARGETAALEARLAGMVAGDRLVQIVVLDRTGRVVATTDRHFAGRLLEDPSWAGVREVQAPTILDEGGQRGILTLAAPVAISGERLGAVRVEVDAAPRSQLPTTPTAAGS